MSEHRVVNKILVGILAVVVGGTSFDSVFAQPNRRSKTVGDLLKKIESQTKKVSLEKKSGALPQFEKIGARRSNVDLSSVKPPSSNRMFYPEGSNEADLERVTDDGIKQLFQLSKRFKNSPRRGEIWLRLAELYVEKARLIEYKINADYDNRLADYSNKKTKVKPKLNLNPAKAYNQKAVQLYSWFLRDYPKDEKVDQALFFLGYNLFELGKEDEGRKYYERLTKEHPKSPYNEESSFALGEYYFEKNDYKKALEFYEKVAKNPRGRLYSFSLYKKAWCLYKSGNLKLALASLEKVIRSAHAGKKGDNSAGGVSKLRLGAEASKDLVIFYAEVGSANQARRYFEDLVGEKEAPKLLEKLAYYYADTGNRNGARALFKDIIRDNPNSDKAFEYQYQIISLYSTSATSKEFRGELFDWVHNYGPKSSWQSSKQGNKELVSKVNQLMESTLRNHVLQLHQTAQNSKAPFSQAQAKEGYQLYFKTFDSGEKVAEMHFFFAEILFDMKDFESAAYHYNWIVKNEQKSQYYEKSLLNTVLALEKTLPTEEALKKRLGDSLDPVPLEKNVNNFIIAAKQYNAAFPTGENVPAIKYKMGALLYYHNQFDDALAVFNGIIKDHPKSKYAEYSANLTLDIYNLKKDFAGLEKAGASILENESLAKSQVGSQVKTVLQQVSFKKAQELEASKDFAGSAAAFEGFAVSNKGSDLAVSALFNAAVNYERAGNTGRAMEMYESVLAHKGASKDLADKSRKILPTLYERLGQYEKAAKLMEDFAKANPKDSSAVNYYYNAAAIQDGLNKYQSALSNYQIYFDKSRGSDRYETLYLMGRAWERQNGITKAEEYYSRYYKSPTKNGSRVVEVAFRNADIFRKKRKTNERETWLKRTISSQAKVSSKDNPVGVRYASEAKFELVRRGYDELIKIKIPADPNGQKKAVERKLKVLNTLKEDLKPVIRYDDGHMVVAALALLGQAYQHMAASIYAVPVPKGLDEESLKQYKAGVDGLAKPFATEAISNYKSAIEKGYSLSGYNNWLLVAQAELQKLDGTSIPYFGESVEIVSAVDAMDDQLDDTKYANLRSAFQGGTDSEVIQEASKLLGPNPNDIVALNTLAMHYVNKKKFGLALIILRRALAAQPDNPALYHNTGTIAFMEGDQREAMPDFRKALELKSSYNPSAAILGTIYAKYGDYSKAEKLLTMAYDFKKKKISRGDRAGIELANALAVSSAYVGNLKKSKSIYEDLIEVDGQNVNILMNYAIFLVEHQKSKSKAQEILDKMKFLTDDSKTNQRVRELESKLSQMKG